MRKIDVYGKNIRLIYYELWEKCLFGWGKLAILFAPNNITDF